MKPAARLQTAIELLDEIELGKRPADAIIADGFRKRRYAGSKDRAAVSEVVYAVLRHRGSLDRALEMASLDADPRRRVLLHTHGGHWSDTAPIDASPHAPAPPIGDEVTALEGAARLLTDQANSLDLPANLPVWLCEAFKDLFGEEWLDEAQAFAAPASVDLRVNTIKIDRETAQQELIKEGIETQPTPLSPLGLRLSARAPITGSDAFKEGLVDIQDEGSQIAALLVDTKPGMRVVDFCAGAGGKSLAMAASMQNKGRIVACDTSKTRLDRAASRLRRAGVHMVERRVLSSERDKWIGRRAGKFDGGFDRVLVDAPCTGLGTLRRNPETAWRVTPEEVEAFTSQQYAILSAAARLVVKGGRLIYVTCSPLRQENETPIAAFLEEREDFFFHDPADIWQDCFEELSPKGFNTETVRLSPAKHGTDGFAITILGRKL